jgi:hypothetical protein
VVNCDDLLRTRLLELKHQLVEVGLGEPKQVLETPHLPTTKRGEFGQLDLRRRATLAFRELRLELLQLKSCW